ncbi:MAG TPA: hypothetical protein VMB21_07480, partial [Candidatus Limnocylindria bacterium]|nr:hypothetical protein [Candidatus Limnocylindria bacterium]
MKTASNPAVELPRARTVRYRRLVFGLYVAALFALGFIPLTLQLSAQGWTGMRLVLWLLFIPLTAQIAYGFA